MAKKQKKLPAGQFSLWLKQTLEAQIQSVGVEVPCGDCTACCTSSYFIHISPEEKQTLASIPKMFQFPAPNLPKGHVLLGYDEQGHCPMLKDNKCSIYERRPLTCRQYDCRVLAAAGFTTNHDKAKLVDQQIRRWKFSFPQELDHEAFSAVQAAALFLREHAGEFPEGIVPKLPTQLAMLALKVHEVFLKPGRSDKKLIKAVMAELEGFLYE